MDDYRLTSTFSLSISSGPGLIVIQPPPSSSLPIDFPQFGQFPRIVEVLPSPSLRIVAAPSAGGLGRPPVPPFPMTAFKPDSEKTSPHLRRATNLVWPDISFKVRGHTKEARTGVSSGRVDVEGVFGFGVRIRVRRSCDAIKSREARFQRSD